MTSRLAYRICILLLVLLTAPAAQARVDICYAGGRLLPNFQLNGDGTLDASNLIVTRSTGNQRSSIVYKTPLSTAGDIRVRMKLQIGENDAGGGADGMAFTMHNDPTGIYALGVAGEGIGYGGVTNSVTVEFDTYRNDFHNDGNDNHIAITTQGNRTHTTTDPLRQTPPFLLKSGTAFFTWIDYTASSSRLEVYVSQSSTKPATPLISTTSVDIPAIVGGQMYLMFSGSTGGSWSKHEILELHASDEGQPGEACCASDNDCSGSSLGPICDPVKKSCGECSAENLSACPESAKGCDLSEGTNVCRSKCAGDEGSGAADSCVSSDFPYCSERQQTRGSCLACDVSAGLSGTAPCPSAAPACLDGGFCGLCSSNDDCTNSNAHAGGFCNVATGQCESCSSDAQCASGQTCQSGFCRECSADGECGAGEYCDAVTYRCRAPLAAGEPLPEGVTCPSARVASVCADGDCNPAQETCAKPVSTGNTCSDAKECVENVCGSDGECGCSADADCGAQEYCDGSTRQCETKLPAGAAIPSDPLHGGTCDATNALATCATGLCNPTTNTCAADDGTACPGSDSHCASDTCAASGWCVPAGGGGCYEDSDCGSGLHCNRATFTCTANLASGAPIPSDGIRTGVCPESSAAAACESGMCNATTDTCAEPDRGDCSLAAECVSNTCSSSGKCVPDTGGCYVNADCASSQYCDRDALLCQAKLPAGSSLPSDADGYHDGVCESTLAASVCETGECNPSANTCAATNGSLCSDHDQCVYGVCGGNGECGSVTGDACSPDWAAVCQSGICGASLHCVPAGGSGCYLDVDCGGGQFCDQSSFTCVATLPNGAAIPNDGIRDGTCAGPASGAACSSGLCNLTTNTCAGSIGVSCTAASECVDDVCGSNGSCGVANGDACPSAGATACQSGFCASVSNTCLPDSDSCFVDGECASDEYCSRSTFTCTSKLASGASIPVDGIRDGTCAHAEASVACQSGQCNLATDTCAAANGESCTTASQCVTNACGDNGLCGASDGAPCTEGEASTCQTGTCAPSGHCVPEEGGCYVDDDCSGLHASTGAFCDRSTLLCVPRLEAGAPIPADGLHDGRCTPQNASATCVDEVCNLVTNTCARPNGVACTLAEECVANRCGSNGQCGLADGEGTCTAASGRTLCQSGLCSSSGGLCVPAVTASCQVDGDCSAGEHCDGQTWHCAEDLANGAPIPSDGLRDGSCDALTGAAICASGACNVVTDTCGMPAGAPCGSASECAANVCSGGFCGFGPGEGSCTAATADQRCQSGECSVTGICLAPEGCAADADCAGVLYCAPGTGQCQSRLPSGSPLPAGSCPDSGVTSQCATGRCEPTTDHCGTLTGEPCSQHGECLVGVCGENGLCGATNDSSGCGATAETTLCQSGACVDDLCVSQGACTGHDECAPSAYCDGSECLPKRPSGAPLPESAPGSAGGECTPETGAALCASGVCNVSTGTCAAANGAECGLGLQCTANVCGQNGQCGLTNGAGSCTEVSAAEVCQSGTCSTAGGLCVPPGGCGSLTECAEGSYCNGEIFACEAALPPGAPLPHDPLHDGECNEVTASACASGLCNPATLTCAAPGGDACTSHADCVGNYCHEDGFCGRPDGAGPCRANTEDSCRSGSCSPSTLVCVPATDGCGSSADCGFHEFCGSDHTCQDRLPLGAPVPGGCPESGLSPACDTGLCNTSSNQCAVDNGEPCTDAGQCATGVCGGDERCGASDGSPCDPANPSVCQSGRCDGPEGLATCQPTDACSQDAECREGEYCDGALCRPKARNGRPLPSGGDHDGICTPEAALATCASGACNLETNTCAGDFDDDCADARFCEAGVCGHDGRCGYADGEGPCDVATGATACRSGSCSIGGVCRPESAGGCATDLDCGSGEFCDFATFTCAAQLTAGAPIPSDGLHDGACTPENAAAVCSSGACNPHTDTCAASNGEACTDASECVQDVCGDNGLCGIERGDGPCTVATADQCQTGRCSATEGRCIDAEGGCVVDADCTGDDFCSADEQRCVAKLPLGAPLPDDAIHDGACSPALAVTVCDSGACNPATNTCATRNGEPCTSGAECVTGSCGSNGRCGLAEGDEGCTIDHQLVDCQSGTCSHSGACIPPARCEVHEDCRFDQFCNASLQLCVAKLDPGELLPEACTSTTAAIYCESQLCNAAQQSCALPPGAPCAGAGACESNLCAANDRCGLPDGAGPCTENGECQSGQCQDDLGRCVPNTTDGCSRDASCGEGYCDGFTLVCDSRLPTGARLPNDGVHDGACTTALAQAVCESRLCNVHSDTCAAPNGSECSEPSDCSSNVCASNGRCGREAEDQCRTHGECQSGSCDDTTHRCVLTVTCESTTDCASDQFCNDANLCQQLRPAGSACGASDECSSGSCEAGLCTSEGAEDLAGDGCSCSTTGRTSGTSAPLLLLGLLGLGLTTRRRLRLGKAS